MLNMDKKISKIFTNIDKIWVKFQFLANNLVNFALYVFFSHFNLFSSPLYTL